MTTPTEGRSRGLLFILGATAVAGISGYAIQLLAAALLTDAQAYLSFSAFWSTLYLCGAAVGGVQQEIARATRTRGAGSELPGRLRPFTLGAVAIVVVLAGLVGLLLGPLAFTGSELSLSAALAIGLVGYVLTSVATGLFYGLDRLGTVASLIIVDAVLRGVAVVVALLIGLPLEAIAFTIALPFGLAVLGVWTVVRRRVVGSYELDVATPALARNALHTVLAAAAIGLMVTGMPLLFRISLTDGAVLTVASLTLVVTLTRAPLIIPLMALQSFLIVTFRDSRSVARARMRRYLLVAAAVGIVAAAVAWVVGPWAVALVSQGQYAVDGLTSSLVVLSAALVGCLCITGPALLADGRHAVYSAGWVTAAVATVLLLVFVPAEPQTRAIVALVAAPAIGLAVHLIAMRGTRGDP